MRRYLSIALVASMGLALAACGKKEEPAAEATAPPSEVAATAAAAPTTLAPGDYAVSDKDGKPVDTTTINADGTYREKPVKGLPVAGLWEMKDGKACFDPSGDKPGTCYTMTAPAADGTFTATADDGTVLTVKPVAK